MRRLLLPWLIVGMGASRLTGAAPSGNPPVPTAQPTPAPTELFRRLLAASPQERQKLLAGKPASSVLVISNALREYEALSPGQREVRLRTLELGWYLDPLLRLPAQQRSERLATVPEEWRPPIEQRLKFWDSLPEDLRQQVLASRSAVRVLLVPSAAEPLGPPRPPSSPAASGFPPVPDAKQAQRQRLRASLRLLFDLDGKEQQRILESLPDPHQLHLKKAIEAVQALPAAQRDLCIAGLLKYSSLSPEQQQQFLKNCQRWAALSPEEQAALRRLAALRQGLPPRPPGALPPLPPSGLTGVSSQATQPTPP